MTAMNLSEATLKRIEEVLPRYPQKRSAALPVLHLVQEEQGYISEEATEWIAEKLGLQPINIYELVTFYPMFRQKPIGRRHVKVCRTLSCALVGSHKVCDSFKKAFNCDLDEISPDGDVTIEFVECMADCGEAPVVMVDDELFQKVDEAKVQEIVRQIKEET